MYKILPDEKRTEIVKNIKMLLHASRDCLRNQLKDTTKIAFSANDGYFCEAFGIMRALEIMGYGYFGSSNLDALQEKLYLRGKRTLIKQHNLKWWFEELKSEVLTEEDFGKTNICSYCREKHGKDAALMKRGV